jgi:hypothetical protein
MYITLTFRHKPRPGKSKSSGRSGTLPTKLQTSSKPREATSCPPQTEQVQGIDNMKQDKRILGCERKYVKDPLLKPTSAPSASVKSTTCRLKFGLGTDYAKYP